MNINIYIVNELLLLYNNNKNIIIIMEGYMGHILFWVSLTVWLGFESYLFLFYNRNVTRENDDKKSKYIMVGIILVGMFGGKYIDNSVDTAFKTAFSGFRYLSILFIMMGLAIRVLSVYQLGKSFSVNVGIAQKNSLKTTGLYGIVRHPSYLAEVIAFIGIAIAFNHPVSSTMAILFPTIAFLYRINNEEKVLLLHYGEEYIEYSRKTKKLIPFVY